MSDSRDCPATRPGCTYHGIARLRSNRDDIQFSQGLGGFSGHLFSKTSPRIRTGDGNKSRRRRVAPRCDGVYKPALRASAQGLWISAILRSSPLRPWQDDARRPAPQAVRSVRENQHMEERAWTQRPGAQARHHHSCVHLGREVARHAHTSISSIRPAMPISAARWNASCRWSTARRALGRCRRVVMPQTKFVLSRR